MLVAAVIAGTTHVRRVTDFGALVDEFFSIAGLSP